MGLSAVAKSHNPAPKGFSAKRNRKGLRGISANARRVIRSAGKVMEQQYGTDCLFFATLTTPPLLDIELLRLNRSWRSIQKSVKTRITERLVAYGLPPEMLMVTEVQPKRYKSTGQVCLHLHIAFVNRRYDGAPWAIQHADMDKIWQTILSNKLNRPISITTACNLQPVRHSVSNELGKYFSKSSKITAQICADGKGNYLPENWWNCTQATRKKVKEQTKTHNGKAAELFYDNLELFKEHGYAEFQHIIVRIPDDRNSTKYQLITVGAAGWVKDDFIEIFRGLLSSETCMGTFIGYLSQKTVKVA
jgi:hypothetical protein